MCSDYYSTIVYLLIVSLNTLYVLRRQLFRLTILPKKYLIGLNAFNRDRFLHLAAVRASSLSIEATILL
jgi:hypothetical protein